MALAELPFIWIETSYRIIYRIKHEQIDVLAVIHGARLLPDEL